MARFFRYCFLGLVLASSLTAHASKKIITVAPSELKRVGQAGASPYAYEDSGTWINVLDVGPGRAKISVPTTEVRKYQWPSIKTGLKSALRSTPSAIITTAALAAIFDGLDWVLDPANNSIQKNIPSLPADSGVLWTASPSPLSNPSDACRSLMDQSGVWLLVGVVPVSPYIMRCKVQPYNDSTVYDGPVLYASGGCYETNSCLLVPSLYPVPWTEVDTVIDGISDKNVAVQTAPELLKRGLLPPFPVSPDTLTTSGPSSVPGETVTSTKTEGSDTTVTTTTTTNNLTYSPGYTTVNQTNVTTVYNNGALISTTTQTENSNTVTQPAESADADVPTDCEFMPTVCAFLDWFQEPASLDEPDLPVVDHLDGYSASIGSSAGVCPSPISVDLLAFGTVSVSYQPLCDFAAILRYLVLAGALLFAIYINMGIAKGGNS